MPKKVREREDRIDNEIIVDAHDSEERAMVWYNYLQDKLQCPFTARCIAERPVSPLRKGDEVEVVDMPGEDECRREMFAMIRWEHKRQLAVPLAQLKPTSDTEELTVQAVQDWQYWVKQGYEF